MRRGRTTSHLFLTESQARIAREIIDDLNTVSHQFVPLLASGATKQQMALALGSRWSVPSVDAVLRRFRKYTSDIGRKDELYRRLIDQPTSTKGGHNENGTTQTHRPED